MHTAGVDGAGIGQGVDAAGLARVRVDRPVGGETFQLDGTVLVLRRAMAQDRSAVAAMHGRCTAKSLHRRYLAGVLGDIDRVVAHLVPPPSGVAIGAFTPEGDCVALAHLVPMTDRDAVELAALVQDDWQRYGLGLRLARLILAVPERAGRAVFLLAEADNWPVLALARRLGYRAAPGVTNGFMDIEIAGATLPAPGSA